MHTSVSTPVIGVSTVELEDSVPLAEATGAQMLTRTSLLFKTDIVEAGIWACTPGDSYWTLETHEFIYVVSGRMTVTRDGGESLELAAGDAAFFEKGWRGSWVIHEEIVKSYVVF